MNFSPELLILMAESIGWMLLHSLWQGALVASFLWATVRLVPARNASLRHLVCLGAMLLMVGTSATTAVSHYSAMTKKLGPSSSQGWSAAATIPFAGYAEDVGPGFPVRELNSAEVQRVVLLPTRWELPRVAWPSLGEVLPLFTGLWVAGVFFVTLQRVYAWHTVARWRRRAFAADAAVQGIWTRLLECFGRPGGLAIWQSEDAMAPMLVGVLRPVVLLPLRAISGLGERELEAILAHELAHFIRHDAWFNHAQIIMETLFFYHPAMWWMGQQARQEREHAADDLALGICQDRQVYAEALTHLAELSVPPAPAVAANGGSLMQRIQRIVRLTPDEAQPSGWSLCVPTLVCLLVVGLMVRGQAQIAPASSAALPENQLAAASTPTGASAKPRASPALPKNAGIASREAELASTVRGSPAQEADLRSADWAKAKKKAALLTFPTAHVELKGEAETVEQQVATFQKNFAASLVGSNKRKLAAALTRNREAAFARMLLDKQRYKDDQLREIEQLYQVANTKGERTEEARVSLEQLLEKYDAANRTGCALLYLGQASEGEKRLEYLTRAVEKFSDCYYFNGCQVGGYGRYVLALTLWEKREKDKARALLEEIKTKLPEATDHRGRLMSELVAEAEKELAKQP